MNKNLTHLERERFRNSATSFIKRVNENNNSQIYTGNVISYIPNEDVIIRLTNIPEQIDISWKDGLLIIFDDQSFTEGESVALVSFNGVFIVLGKIINQLSELMKNVTLYDAQIADADWVFNTYSLIANPNVIVPETGFLEIWGDMESGSFDGASFYGKFDCAALRAFSVTTTTTMTGNNTNDANGIAATLTDVLRGWARALMFSTNSSNQLMITIRRDSSTDVISGDINIHIVYYDKYPKAA